MFNDSLLIQRLKVGNKNITVYDGYYLNNQTTPKDNENVVCFDADGNLLWKINGAKESGMWSENDTFVGVSNDNQDVIATTFSGNVFYVDIETGKATYKSFTK